MENFLEKFKKLTPIQSTRQSLKYSPYKKKQNHKILKETKLLHQKRKDLTRIQIIEFSILFIILNNLNTASKKMEDLSELEFLAEKNENLKKEIVTYLIAGNNKEEINQKIKISYEKIIKEINENSNIQIIIKNKKEEEIANLLDELIKDHKEQTNLRKIESLEQKLINNLDENSFTELVKLKSQLNRD